MIGKERAQGETDEAVHPLTLISLLPAPMLKSQFLNKISYLPSCHSLITTSWSEIDVRDNLLNVHVIRLKNGGETTGGTAPILEAESVESIVICKDAQDERRDICTLEKLDNGDILASGNDVQDLDTSRDFIQMFKCVGLKTVIYDSQEIVLLRESDKLYAIDVMKKEARCVWQGGKHKAEGTGHSAPNYLYGHSETLAIHRGKNREGYI